MAERKQNPVGEQIIDMTVEEVMHNSMMPYSEYVIMDRALPRVEDGLKPVQRRILYSMYELGITPDKPHRKSARIVGDCLGKFHPHGDKSVYDAMVRMAQAFNMRGTLIDGHGNFGSTDGDPAAAMRYTEARLAPLALELLRDIDKNTVKWSCNFDDTMMEPDMLPGRFPNLLVNGASGIAVGLATNIPPHNIVEVIDGVIAYIDNPRMRLRDMMKIIKGPDFPTGGFIISSELEKAYETGKGRIIMRAKVHIENGDNDRKLIVIDELPYQVNKASLLEAIRNLREDKKGVLAFISDITDESDRNGMRAVIKVKRDGDPKAILEVLFKSTSLSTNFGINMVAIADGKPQQMGLLDIIAYYVNYQRDVILRRSRFELDEAKARAHILEGLVIAVRNIDEVVKIIRSSNSTSEARDKLRKRFELSEKQAQAILDLRLARLTHLEIFKLEKELEDVKANIERLTAIVGSRRLQMDLVKTELVAVKKTFKDARRSTILGSIADYVVPSDDDEKPIEEIIVAYTQNNQLKRMAVKNFTMATKDFTDNSSLNELCPSIIRVMSNELIYAFTNLGNCYKIEPLTICEGKWREKGGSVSDLIKEFGEGERIVRMFAVGEEMPKGKLMFFTRFGMIKKSEFGEFKVVKASFQAIKLKEGDEVISVEPEIDGATALLVTADGMCLNCELNDVPTHGRVAAGVKGISMNDDMTCVLATQISGEGEAVLISDAGYAKRVILAQLDVMGRYRKGVKIFDLGGKDNGTALVFGSVVTMPYKVVIVADIGVMTAFSTEDISIENRTHKGKPLLKGKHYISTAYKYKDTLDN